MARKRYKAFTFTPSQGGQLMASVSKDTVGIKHYLTKRDFRRLLDREQRREGYDYFAPKDTLFTNQYSQDTGTAAEINLVHMARRPNGDKAIIVGTTTGYLLRYTGSDVARYFADSRDADFDLTYEEEDGDATPGEAADTYGAELVSGNYSSGTKTVSTVAGEEYLYVQGVNETSLVNGEETLTASGYFKAQGSSITLNGRTTVVVTASIKKHQRNNDYATTMSSEWTTIYTPNSNSVNRKRWEAVNINGYTVFNNGADLPVVYRVEWDEAKPIYALREAGIARAGSIAELNGVLILGNVSQIQSKHIDTHMRSADPYGYYTDPVDNIGYRVVFSDLDDPTSYGATVSATVFSGARVMAWRWNPKSLGNEEITIVGAGVGGGNLTTRITGRYAKAASSFTVNDNYKEGEYLRGSKGVSVTGTVSPSVGLDRAIESGEIVYFGESAAFELTENAAAGANEIYGRLIGGGISKSEKGTLATQYVKVADEALTSAYATELFKAGAFASTSGFDDLQDDGSTIMKMAKLQNVLVIYKETSIFIAEYTGSADAPFRFDFVKLPSSKCLKYRHTVCNVEGMAHIYAGANAFYSIDLASRRPKEIPEFKNADTLFFDNAELANTESIYAADNQLTKEIWFVTNKGTASDKALCFDYIFRTLSTTSMDVTAAATVEKPGESEDWFVMGNGSGIMLLYGLNNESNSRWSGKNYFSRRGNTTYSTSAVSYDSVLESGAEDFGDTFGEKDMRSYVLHLSHTSDSPSTRLDLFGYHNVGDVVSGSASSNLLDTRVYDDPDTKNLFPVYYRQHYFQDRIQVSTGNVQYAGKTYELAGVDSRSFVRTDDA